MKTQANLTQSRYPGMFFCWLSLIALTYSTSILEDNCIKRQTPEKFGILTTTYIRGGSTTMFNDYLKRYAESDCQIYDNIYIIWNNQQTPQEMGILANKEKWKKNVYFMQTIQNSLDFKYIVPYWAKEKVFFSMDDDFDITCQTLKTGFGQWQNSSYGQVAPLSSFYGRSYVFQPQTQSFTYIDQIKLNKEWNYYHFGLTGIAFISRHLLQLYYSDIYQIKQMRKQVVSKNNCQDLLLNFLISYLYPQLVGQYLKLPFTSLGFTGVSATKAHKSYRAECITRFSEIIGYNPMRYIRAVKDQQLAGKRTEINENCLVNLKQQNFEQNFINNRAYYLYIKKITGVDDQFIRDQNKRLQDAKIDIQKFSKTKLQENLQNDQYKPLVKAQAAHLYESQRKMLQQQQMNIHFGSKQQILAVMLNLQMSQQQLTQTNFITQNKEGLSQVKESPSQVIESSSQVATQQLAEEGEESVSLLLSQNQHALYLIILSFTILSVLCFKKIMESRKNKYETVPLTLSSQF